MALTPTTASGCKPSFPAKKQTQNTTNLIEAELNKHKIHKLISPQKIHSFICLQLMKDIYPRQEGKVSSTHLFLNNFS